MKVLDQGSYPSRLTDLQLILGELDDGFIAWLDASGSASSELANLVRGCHYEGKLRRFLDGRPDLTASPNKLFGAVDDAWWYWMNTEGCRKSLELQRILPGLPASNVQSAAVGSAGDVALREGFGAYLLFKQLYQRHHGRLADCAGVLDFGCGWGRILRFFLRDLEPKKLWGIDCSPPDIETCKQTNRWCQFQANEIMPPTWFADGTFDLIYCYSVFSHLAEDAHRRWLEEFKRILRPGGLLIATTWDRDFIQRCSDLRKDPSLDCEPEWRIALSRVFLDTPRVLADYDAGKFCFGEYDKERHEFAFLDGAPVYGEACISKAYVLSRWTKYFAFVDFIDDRKRCSQNVIVVRR